LDRREDDLNSYFKDVSTRPKINLTTALSDGLSDPSVTQRAARLARELSPGFGIKKQFPVIVNEAAEAKALAAFHQSLAAPRGPEDDRCRRWHERLVELAKILLDLRGIAFEEVPGTDGCNQLVILPVAGRSHLNDFAHDVSTQLDGIAFVYSPRDLLKPEGSNNARASFHREKNRILLPKGFLDHPRIDDAIYHEVLHAVFHDLLKNGITSLFHGWVRSHDRVRPMWPSPHYRFRMSLEELATHALNLQLIAVDYRMALQRQTPAAEALLRRLRMKATTLNAIATEVASLLGKALGQLGDGAPLKLDLSAADPKAPSLVSLLWVRLFLDHIEIRMPLVASDPAELSAWEALTRGDRVGEAAEVARNGVRERFLRRLRAQKEVAAEMSGQTADILRWLSAYAEPSLSGLPPSDDRFWELVSAPRNLSLQYLTRE
jgi:hypothetical protein